MHKFIKYFIIIVGQCGNQIGSAFWPLVLQEYGIPLQSSNTNTNARNNYEFGSSFGGFFTVPDGRVTHINSLRDLKAAKVKARVNLFLFMLYI